MTEVFLNVTEVFLNVTEVFLNVTEVFLTLTEVFPCFFLSCKANARVKLAKTGHGPHPTTLVVFVLFCCFLCCSMYFLCVNVYCHRVKTQLQLINISITLDHFLCLTCRSSERFVTLIVHICDSYCGTVLI